MTVSNGPYKNLQTASVNELRQVILSAPLTPPALESAQSALDFLSGVDSGSLEYKNTLMYIDYIVRLPWVNAAEDSKDLSGVEQILSTMCDGSVNKNAIMNLLSSRAEGPGGNGKILVVDDEHIALKNLSHLLRKESYDVVTSSSGEDAIEKLDNDKFDIVMTDLRMANVDGIQVLEKAKAVSPETHVIVITGYATTETAVEAMRKGAFHYLMKPIQIEELRSIVKEALNKKKPVLPKRSILCLNGTDEKKKSEFGRALAESLGTKFTEIQLAGINDESAVTGINRLSGGGSPGCIIKHVCDAGAPNPIVMIHDIDMVDANIGKLLNDILSPANISSYVDNFIEVPFDLSKVIFIATAKNAEDTVSPLKESLEIIDV